MGRGWPLSRASSTQSKTQILAGDVPVFSYLQPQEPAVKQLLDKKPKSSDTLIRASIELIPQLHDTAPIKHSSLPAFNSFLPFCCC